MGPNVKPPPRGRIIKASGPTGTMVGGVLRTGGANRPAPAVVTPRTGGMNRPMPAPALPPAGMPRTGGMNRPMGANPNTGVVPPNMRRPAMPAGRGGPPMLAAEGGKTKKGKK